MLDTEKLMEKVKKEVREEVQIESAIGIIRKFMSLGMSFEKALSEAQECIQLSNNSVQYLKEKLG